MKDHNHPAYEIAKRIYERKHFKVAYSINLSDMKIHPQPGRVLAEALCQKFGSGNIYHDTYYKHSGGVLRFSLTQQDGDVVSARAESKTLPVLPASAIDFIFVNPDCREDVQRWLIKEKQALLESSPVEGEEK